MATFLALLTVLALASPGQGSARTENVAEEVRPSASSGSRDPLPGEAIGCLGTMRWRYAQTAYDLAYSPKGDVVAVACGTQVLRWDAITGKSLPPIDVGTRVWRLTFFPDGKRLAVTAQREPIKGKPSTAIRVIALGSTGERIRSAPAWDHETPIMAVSPDGKWLAFREREHLRIWDYENDRTVFSLPTEGRDWRVGSIAFSPDGKYLAAAGGYNGLGHKLDSEAPIVLYDLKNGEVAARLLGHSAGPHTLSFSADGDVLLSCGTDASVRVWDVRKRQQTLCIDKEAYRAALSPDGQLAAFCYNDRFIALWDTHSGKQVREIPTTCLGAPLAFSPDGKRLAAIGNAHCVGVFDVATGTDVFGLPGHQHAVRSIAFSADGKMLASQGLDGTVRLWDAALGAQTHVLAAWARNDNRLFDGMGIAISPDGSMVAAVGDRQDAKVHVWGTARGDLLAEWDVPGSFPLMAAFLPDGKTLAILAEFGIISLRSVPDGKTIKSFLADPNMPRQVSRSYGGLVVSPDGHTLVTTQAVSRVRVSDYSTGKLLLQFETPPGGAWDIAYSPNGRILASGGVAGEGRLGPGSIFLWEAATGRPLGTIGSRETGAVQRFALSPDGRLMATGDEKENIVRVWNVFTGKELAKFRGHSGLVTCLAFSPDGKRLASGSFDTTILLWDVSKLDRSLPEWRPTPKELEVQAEKLQGDDGPAVFQAVARLAAAGDAAVALLRPRLRPVAAPDEKRIAELLADLDDNAFDVRDAAARELGALGRLAEPHLRKALAGGASAEFRRQAEALLSACEGKPATPQEVKEMRAVWVLEEGGTVAARQCLEELAKGAPGARLTQEAKASLRRLTGPPAGKD